MGTSGSALAGVVGRVTEQFLWATGYRAVIGLETDQLFGVALIIGLVSGRDRASFGLLFGFQLGFPSEPALGQGGGRAVQLTSPDLNTHNCSRSRTGSGNCCGTLTPNNCSKSPVGTATADASKKNKKININC